MRQARKVAFTVLLFSGMALMTVNLFGLSQMLRPSNIQLEHLRFGQSDVVLDHANLLTGVLKLQNESSLSYSQRLTKVIADGIAHIHWFDYPPEQFNQLVPVWENWVLHLMGRFSGIPEFERYHYSSPNKSMERGIGLCGDAAILMHQLLAQNGITAKIMSFSGHVVISANVDGQDYIFDPDFGVYFSASPEQLRSSAHLHTKAYSSAGYPLSDELFFNQQYTQEYELWDGPQHFITKKFYFEKLSYIMKWSIPLLLIIVGLWGMVSVLGKR